MNGTYGVSIASRLWLSWKRGELVSYSVDDRVAATPEIAALGLCPAPTKAGKRGTVLRDSDTALVKVIFDETPEPVWVGRREIRHLDVVERLGEA